ncbi:helix-turn-helix domain-containing protein [Pararhizobium antarcticum]|uniref:AraC family transcriptional regulator n=1 Tax=Pararhizobium antarcticum TaxID=1798805 RepID=A0A657LT73_9HYPH|nr:helix-turn-helix domain-containing protein [Pararhizobium antarcticum]OJF96237.1 AraC family transcriptional regulator [Rhizobium sp. 58]OJF97781.1 AraC family transcriptional regulator [Pararhizobium antarcticum]
MPTAVPTYDLYGEKTGENMRDWLHCETIPARSRLHHWEIRLHRHESFFQILYMHAGSGDAIFGNQRHEIRAHSVITVPPGVDHGFRFSRDTDGFVVTILASRLRTPPGDRSHLGAWLALPHVTLLDVTRHEGAYVADTLMRLGAEYAAYQTGRNDLLDAYLTLALHLTARLSPASAGESMDDKGRRMERLNSLIHRHLRAHKPASFYAAELGISPTHLNRFLKSVTGLGTHDMIARKLIDEAKRELVFSFGSIKDVSESLGFVDPAYFSRLFSKQTGATPRAWRMAERAKLDSRSTD